MREITPNPARKLYTQFLLAVEVGATTHPVAWVWSQVWQVDRGSAEFGRMYAGLITLAADVREAVESRLPNLTDAVDRRMGDVESRLVSDSENEWSKHWRSLQGQAVLDVLELAAAMLDGSDETKLVVLDADGLAEHIRKTMIDVNGLADEDLPVRDKRRVLRHLSRALRVVDNAEVVASDELVDVVQGAAGYVLGDHELVRRLASSPAGQATLATFVAFKLLTGGEADVTKELPPPSPEIIVNVTSQCYQPPELEAGSTPAALPPAEVSAETGEADD